MNCTFLIGKPIALSLPVCLQSQTVTLLRAHRACWIRQGSRTFSDKWKICITAQHMVNIFKPCFLDEKCEYIKVLLRIRPRQSWAKALERNWVSELPYKMEEVQLYAIFQTRTQKYFDQSKYFSKICIGVTLLSAKSSVSVSQTALISFERIAFV